ncbi:hypothetical protein LIER_17329 [Lithospermum erythrorhizon]|uniref:Uncharacterized protein n=1 Tax=Lithospermum erythrorhizon TaxID=34254 RepID=A0AAV3QE18_LITER
MLKFRGVCDVDMDVGVQGNDTVGGDNDVDVHDGVVGFFEAQDVVESDRVDVGLDNMNDDGFTMDGVYDDLFNDEGPNLAHGSKEEDVYEDSDQLHELVDHDCEDTGSSWPIEYNKNVHRDNPVLILERPSSWCIIFM